METSLVHAQPLARWPPRRRCRAERLRGASFEVWLGTAREMRHARATMPTITTLVPAKMSKVQRAALLAEVAHAFDVKFVCLDHKKRPRCTLKRNELSCEVCCDELALIARLALPGVVRMAAGRS